MSKWEWKKLGEVAKIYNGNSINANVKKERYSNVESGFPFIATKDVGNDSEVDYENGIRIPFEEAGFKVARKDTVLICAEGGSAGKKKCILNEDVCFGNKLFAIDYNREKLIGKFVFYYTFEQSFTDEFQKLLSGIIGGVSSAKFKEIQIPIPPLSEQNRIVKFLDEEFSKIDTLKTNAETNLKNAKELFETTLEKELNSQSRHSERSEESSAELPSGWEWKTLGDVCEILSDLINPTEEKYLNMYHVGGANIESETGRIIDLKTSEEEGLTSGKFVFDDSVVLYNKIRPYLKKVARPNFAGICSADMYPLSPKNGMLKDFLYYILIASDFTDYAIKHSDRAGMPKLNRKALFVYEFPLPPLSVQKEIVARLDKLSENVKRLEANYKQIIANCDELKKSILKKTFEGDSRSSRE
ncbi:restriction endonuclease subunit S [Fibrobacter sp. UWB13]|uniref:restriction endonuclease subunit S n=1 Tax=Fibrobacter sp. UWB13 TaxID=1896204 RepID=UPI000A0C7572|nr:restriction endonuclease subunit S [Fibrobacter sp. UWB13]SMG26466.1 type I restriction enzyme, S subunit [Fibrobacter sp. UWB13]